MGEDLGEVVEENPTSTNVYTSVHNLHTLCCRTGLSELRLSEITLMNRVDQSQGSKLSVTDSLTHSLTDTQAKCRCPPACKAVGHENIEHSILKDIKKRRTKKRKRKLKRKGI